MRLKNAWYDVGVGSSASGAVNPPTDYDNGAPPAPQNIFADLVNPCDNNAHTVHNIYHTVFQSNLTYALWFTQGATTVLKTTSNSSPTLNVWNAAPVTVRASACNYITGACSAMSADSEELLYMCY